MSEERYFAYGSNLLVARLAQRVPGSRTLGIAVLDDHRLVCDKHGRDGSAKANLMLSLGDAVWGAVYRLPIGGLERLDAFEGGYRRVEVALRGPDGVVLHAVTYRSDRLTDHRVPFDWYREMIVTGARAHGLPTAYVAFLESLPSRPDPSR